MFPRYVYKSSDGKATSWILVDNEDEKAQAIKDGWSDDIPAALEVYNNPKPDTEPVAPKRRGRPAKVAK